MQDKNPTLGISQLKEDFLDRLGLGLSLLRLDEIHPVLNGNKWYKLKYNLREMRSLGKTHLVSFGGAFSNHLAAVAAAGFQYGIRTTGIVRGEEHLPLNPTLSKALEQGMNLEYVDREKYRNKPELMRWAEGKFGPEAYILPEGGSNELAFKGCLEILEGITPVYEKICCACGTGITLAGIASSPKGRNRTIGFSALKDTSFFYRALSAFAGEKVADETPVISDYHFGGYGKIKPELVSFVKEFYTTHGIQLDYLYNGKMMFGIYELARKGFFRPGTQILAIHTGGLQGNAGIDE